MHADRRTDIAKLKCTFCDNANLPKILLEQGQSIQTALEVPCVSLYLPLLALEWQTIFQDPIFISATVKRAL
jgi:hypothetical protein